MNARDTSPRLMHHFTFAILAGVTFAADAASKVWAERRLSDFRQVSLIVDRITLTLAKNRGGAGWSEFARQPAAVRWTVFAVLALVALGLLMNLHHQIYAHVCLRLGIPLFTAGVLGNTFDGARHGYIVDFIDVRVAGTHHWPMFNLGDVFICTAIPLAACGAIAAVFVEAKRDSKSQAR